MNHKAHMDNLFYDVGKQAFDFLVSGLWRYPSGDRSTKWYKYSEKVMPVSVKDSYKLKWINQRQIFPNEVVIDLEERHTLPKVVKGLLSEDFTFKVFDTGSRGFHIHIFFRKRLTQQEKLVVIRKYGGDEMMAIDKHMINLEYAPHWKSKKIKKEVKLGFILGSSFK